MFCSKCGAPLAQGATFCSNCGKPTAVASAPAPHQFAQSAFGPPPAPISGLAIAALILSLTVSIVGLILGYMARSEIRESNGTKTGEDLATASIVIGWIFTLIGALVIVLMIVAAVVSASNRY
jgi:hypothetical protein